MYLPDIRVIENISQSLQLTRLLEHPDVPGSFMTWLLSKNIADWSPKDVPNTKMKQELIEASMPTPQRFVIN